MPKPNDPLASLISNDVKSIGRQKLADLLSPFIVIDESSHEFSFHELFHERENTDKVEIILAATKARALYFEEQDGLLPSEIISIGVIPAGSVKSSLKSLFDNHKIKKDKEGRYFLPSYRIPELGKALQAKE